MPFQMEIGSLGEVVIFQVGLCTPLQTMVCLYYKENVILRHIKAEHFPNTCYAGFLCQILSGLQTGYLVLT